MYPDYPEFDDELQSDFDEEFEIEEDDDLEEEDEDETLAELDVDDRGHVRPRRSRYDDDGDDYQSYDDFN